MTFDIAKLARPNILTLEPYTCARDLFKTGILLDANENTHGPSIPDIKTSEEQLELNRYPDPHQLVLKQQICDFRNSEANTEIAEVSIPDGKLLTPANLALGVGSDESIDALLRCFVAPAKEKLLICPPTYGMYNICATVNDVEIVKVPLSLPSFQVQVDSIMDTLSKDPSIKLIYVTSPGNPTATKLNYSLVIEILEKIQNGNFNVLFVVDEAYIDFSPIGSSVSVLVNKYPNLVVLQTLSKSFGLAGIRLGITYADPSVALLMNSMKYPYNISNLTSDVAIRATTKEAIASMRSKVAIINTQRGVLLKELLSLERIGENKGGLVSNFLLLEVLNEEGKPDNEVANKVYLQLANEKAVVVRFRGNEYGCTGCLRITVGTEDENKRLVEAFKSVFAAL